MNCFPISFLLSSASVFSSLLSNHGLLGELTFVEAITTTMWTGTSALPCFVVRRFGMPVRADLIGGLLRVDWTRSRRSIIPVCHMWCDV